MATKLHAADVFDDPGMFAGSLLLAAVDMFGTDVINWDPETIQTEIHGRLGVDLDQLTSNKLNAALGLLSGNMYFKSLPGFCAVNSALSFKSITPAEFQGCMIDDIAWGVTEAKLIMGSEDFDSQEFTHDIRHYTGEMLSLAGITSPPDFLGFAEFRVQETDERDVVLDDDPVMSAMYWDRQQSELDSLNSFVAGNMERLLQQLMLLPVSNAAELQGKAQEALTRLRKSLQEQESVA